MVAGPNGSGKTTIIDRLRAQDFDLGRSINADEIEKTLLSGSREQRTREAQRLAESARRTCLQRRQTFTFETVMSHPSKVEFIRTARGAGYDTLTVFVGLANADINVQRVEDRIQAGGHAVPEDKIRGRYDRAMSLLFSAARASAHTVVFDNTSENPVGTGADQPGRLIARLASDGVHVTVVKLADPIPAWVQVHLLDRITEECGPSVSDRIESP